MSCPDQASALLLAEAVNDEPFVITLPYRFTALPDGYRPASVTIENGGDETDDHRGAVRAATAGPTSRSWRRHCGIDLASLPGQQYDSW